MAVSATVKGKFFKGKKKRKKPANLKGKSSALLRGQGWIGGDVERHAPNFITFDFLGLFDLLFCRFPAAGCTGVQVTDNGHATDHRETIFASPNTKPWLLCGNRILLHLWNRTIVGKVTRWILTVEEFKCDSDGMVYMMTHAELEK